VPPPEPPAEVEPEELTALELLEPEPLDGGEPPAGDEPGASTEPPPDVAEAEKPPRRGKRAQE
jgi:hypothetical protein